MILKGKYRETDEQDSVSSNAWCKYTSIWLDYKI